MGIMDNQTDVEYQNHNEHAWIAHSVLGTVPGVKSLNIHNNTQKETIINPILK